jgi:hypothetical protein
MFVSSPDCFKVRLLQHNVTVSLGQDTISSLMFCCGLYSKLHAHLIVTVPSLTDLFWSHEHHTDLYNGSSCV